MPIIEVEGLDFEIKADAPSTRERLAIETYLQAQKTVDRKTGNPVFDLSKDNFKINPSDVFSANQLESNQDTENYFTSKEFQRLVTEVAFSIGGTAAAAAMPAIGIPLLLARVVKNARPLLNVAQRTIGASVGGGVGGGVSQTFDPKEDIIAEVTRSTKEGALGNLIGEGGARVLSGIYNKVVGRKIDTLQSAREAGSVIDKQKEVIKDLLSKADRVGKTNLSPEEIAKLSRYESNYGTAFLKEADRAMLTPDQVTQNAAVDIAANIGESAFFGASTFGAVKGATQNVVRSGIDDFVETIKVFDQGPGREVIGSPDMLGEVLRNAITKKSDIFNAVARKGYSKLDDEIAKQSTPYLEAQQKIIERNALLPVGQKLPDIVNPFSVNTTPLKELAKKKIAELSRQGGFAEEAIKKYEKVLSLKDKANFADLNATRSTILALGRNLSDDAARETKGAQTLITNKITQLLDDTKIPSELSNFRTRLNNFYRDGATGFNKPIIEKILNKDYGREKIYNQIISNSDQPSLVRNYFDAIDNLYGTGTKGKVVKLSGQGEYLKDAIRGEFFRDMLQKSSTGGSAITEGVVDAAKMNLFIKQHKTLLDPLKNQNFLTKFQTEKIKNLQNALAFTQGTVLGKPSGLGKIFIQLKQAGALTQLGAFGLGASGTIEPVSAGTIILAPYLISRAFTNPKIAKLIIEGAKPRDFKSGTTAISQLVTKLAAEDYITPDDANAFNENLNIESKQFQKNLQDKKPTAAIGNVNNTVITPSQPVNTRITDIQTRPMSAPMNITQTAAPTGNLQERIAQSNQLDQFIPVR